LLIYKDARVHCEVLKIRASPHHQHPKMPDSMVRIEKPPQKRPTPQNPTVCLTQPPPRPPFHSPERVVLNRPDF